MVHRHGAMTGRVRPHPGETGGLAGPRAEKSVSLALQGGGAHGAFTWGVLDALLEDGRLAVEAITGASAGATNAVVMVEGWLGGGIDGARSQLETFWRRASFDGSLSPAQRKLLSWMLGFWSIQALMDVIAQRSSPYETNPLNINPLRDAIDALIDFDRVRACTDVEIFISATNVWTGKVAIFRRQELTADHLMASACLPTVFQAVEIDGVPYWDGGYMGNPALYPLYYESMTDDILLVQINPLERRQTRVHRSDAPRRALPQAHRSPALGTVPRRRRIHEIRRSYLVGTWAEHVRQRDNRLTGADRRFKEQARAYAVGEPQVAHLFPPACEGADQEAVDGQTPASPQSLRFPAVNSVAAQRTSSRR